MRVRNLLIAGAFLTLPVLLTGCKDNKPVKKPAPQVQKAKTPAPQGNLDDYLVVKPNLVTPPQCLLASPTLTKEKVMLLPPNDTMKIHAELSAKLLTEFKILDSEGFKEFAKLTSSLDNNQLLGLASRYPDEYFSNLGVSQASPLYQELALPGSLRTHLEFMAFANAFENMISKHDALLSFRAGLGEDKSRAVQIKELEALLREPSIYQPEVYAHYIELYKDLYASAVGYPNVGVFLQHPNYLWVTSISSSTLKALTEGSFKDGKWVMYTDSLQSALQILKKLIPCFDKNQLKFVKVDLSPYANKAYRLIFYGKDKNPQAKEMLESISGKKLLWVYDWQCIEAGTLTDIVSLIHVSVSYHLSNRPFNQEEKKKMFQAYEQIQKNPSIFTNLGLSEFQRQVFLRGIMSAVEAKINLADPLDYIVAGYVKELSPFLAALLYITDPKFKPLIQHMLKKEAADKAYMQAGSSSL